MKKALLNLSIVLSLLAVMSGAEFPYLPSPQIDHETTAYEHPDYEVKDLYDGEETHSQTQPHEASHLCQQAGGCVGRRLS